MFLICNYILLVYISSLIVTVIWKVKVFSQKLNLIIWQLLFVIVTVYDFLDHNACVLPFQASEWAVLQKILHGNPLWRLQEETKVSHFIICLFCFVSLFYVWTAVHKKQRGSLHFLFICFYLWCCLWLTVRGCTRLLILQDTLTDTCGQCTWKTGRRWRARCPESVSVETKCVCGFVEGDDDDGVDAIKAMMYFKQ